VPLLLMQFESTPNELNTTYTSSYFIAFSLFSLLFLLNFHVNNVFFRQHCVSVVLWYCAHAAATTVRKALESARNNKKQRTGHVS